MNLTSLISFALCAFIFSLQIECTFTTHHHYHHHPGMFYHAASAASASATDFIHHAPLAFKFPRRPSSVMDVNNIVRFSLYTRQNPYTPQLLDISSGAMGLSLTNLKTDRNTKILIHGFVDSASDSTAGQWMTDMRDAFLSTEDVNVIVMDYSIVALFLFYWTNLPSLSAGRLAELIYFLHKTGAPYDSFHLIGRSWGSHIAGMTGRTLSGQLGRITGLDPANHPPFKAISYTYRLDKTDAKFVDVYHLNGKHRFLLLNVIGMPDKYDGLTPPEGTVDVYPNYLQRQITGCPISNASRYTESCRLGLGARLFIETIKRRDAFPICYCESFLKYLRGECQCSVRNLMFMGNNMSTTTPTGVYQLADMDLITLYPPQQVQGGTTEKIEILTTSTVPPPPPSSSSSSFTEGTENTSDSSAVIPTNSTIVETTTTPSSSLIISTTFPTSTIKTSTTTEKNDVTTNKEVVMSPTVTPADEGRRSVSAKLLPRTSKGSSQSSKNLRV